MNNNDITRNITKKLLGSSSKDTPVHLDMLNSALIVCLGAYVIELNKEIRSTDTDNLQSYDHWLSLVDSRDTIYTRDLIYDLIFPSIPKELREAVKELEQNEVSHATTKSLVHELFILQPDRETIKDIVEYIISSYYPLVIVEAIDTPKSINRLCMAILNPSSGSFYDGVSGVGSTCIEAGRHAKKNQGLLSIYAQEKLNVLCAVSVIRAYMNGIERFTVRSGDTLTSPEYTKLNTVDQFDYSVMFPPLGLRWEAIKDIIYMDKYHRFSFESMPMSNSEWLFVQHQIASLKEKTGRGIIAVSTGTLFNTAARWIRNSILHSNCIECIITLPANILSFTTTPLSLIVINKNTPPWQTNSGVLMIQTESMFRNTNATRVVEQLDEQVIEQIVLMIKTRVDTPYSRIVTTEEIEANENILLPSRYIFSPSISTEFGPLMINFHQTQKWPKLRNISQKIYRGINVSRPASEVEGSLYKIINYADIQDGVLQTENLKEYRMTGKVERCLVQPGDVLISCKGAQIKTCVVPEGVEDTLLSINFIGVRLQKKKYCSEYLLQHLNSPFGLAYLKGRQIGTSIITLKNDDIEQMPIPDISLEMQQKCVLEFTSVRHRIEEEMQQLYHYLKQAKWKLYNEMGLGGVLNREDE